MWFVRFGRCLFCFVRCVSFLLLLSNFLNGRATLEHSFGGCSHGIDFPWPKNERERIWMNEKEEERTTKSQEKMSIDVVDKRKIASNRFCIRVVCDAQFSAHIFRLSFMRWRELSLVLRSKASFDDVKGKMSSTMSKLSAQTNSNCSSNRRMWSQLCVKWVEMTWNDIDIRLRVSRLMHDCCCHCVCCAGLTPSRFLSSVHKLIINAWRALNSELIRAARFRFVYLNALSSTFHIWKISLFLSDYFLSNSLRA